MGIYIKDMELPHEEVEPMHLELYADGTVFFMKAPDDCYEFNAVPVRSHVDLIDRNALLEKYYGRFGQIDEVAIEAIKAAPTIIPASDD